MKVIDYTVYEIPPDQLLLKLSTDTGIEGWGDPTLWTYPHTVSAAVKELCDKYLVGKDPLEIEKHWQALYRGGYFRGGPIIMSAISGIDQALWDIKGKRFETPVYELLGGKSRDKIRVYKWIGGDVQDVAEARQAIQDGFTAVKIEPIDQLEEIDTSATTEQIRQRVENVREAIGEEADICVDLRGRSSKTMAKRLASLLEPYDLLFLEEPLQPEDLISLPALANGTTVPLAFGERLHTRWEFQWLFELADVDVVQPDVNHAGGITEMVKIASIADVNGANVAPSRPITPVSLAATMQVSALIPNHLIHDGGFEWESGTRSYIDPDTFTIEDGYLELPTDPGLGIDIDEEVVQELDGKQIGQSFPVRYHHDGSVSER